MALQIRRRELRCCLILVFVFVAVASSWVYATDSLDMDMSLPNIEAPEWFRFTPKPTPSESELSKEDMHESNTQNESTTTISPTILQPANHLAQVSSQNNKIETSIPRGAYIQGFTVLDNLYMRNGTFFIVTSDAASKFPSRSSMISKPLIKAAGVDIEPTDQDLQFVHPSRAKEVLGLAGRPIRIDGLSVIVNDPPSKINTFYQWWAEIMLGSWRMYSKLGLETPKYSLPLPSRFILPAVSKEEWTKNEMRTGPLMRISFSNTSIEHSDYWRDLASLDSTVLFDRAILVSHEAAYKHPHAPRWLKMISGVSEIDVPTRFWQPIRDTVVRNILGYLPGLDDVGEAVEPSMAESRTSTKAKPVVTYISRQESARRLDEKDHEGLVDALQALEKQGVCDFNVLDIERATLVEQIALTAKSTIIVGVHGQGLTHQLWMNPSPSSTVLEIMWPNAYVFDHEIVSRNLGHQHYAVWNDTLVAYKEGNYKGIYYGENFDSNTIPVYGSAVAKIVRARLSR